MLKQWGRECVLVGLKKQTNKTNLFPVAGNLQGGGERIKILIFSTLWIVLATSDHWKRVNIYQLFSYCIAHCSDFIFLVLLLSFSPYRSQWNNMKSKRVMTPHSYFLSFLSRNTWFLMILTPLLLLICVKDT